MQNQTPVPIWKTLRRVQDAIQADQSEFASYLELTSAEFSRLRENEESPSLASLMALVERTDLHFDSLMEGRIDYKALGRHWHGGSSEIPAQYSIGAFSKVRTVTNLLDYIELNYGPYKRSLILRRLQLNEACISDPSRDINLRCSIDVANYLYGFNQSKEEVIRMGSYSSVTLRNSPVGKRLSTEARTASELYEVLFRGLAKEHIEQNYVWKLRSATPDACVVTGRPSPDILSFFGEGYTKSMTACWIRWGYLQSLPEYLGLPSGIVSKTACVCQGDAQCEFRIEFRKAQRPVAV